MTPPFEHIADRIRVALAHQKLTQRELSRRAGLAETQVSVILVRLRERPYAVELETLARIAAGAQVSLFWLLTGVEEADVGAPPSLQHRPGWAAAVEGLAQRLPPLQPWVWTWLGACRLPAEPPLQPSPTLLHDLVAVLQRQYGNEAVFVPARPAYEIPPITRRPKSKQAAPAPRQKKPRA
jgi:transcriptional regulator with XRE-family HTH domain